MHKGQLIMAWIDMLAAMAARPTPPVWREAPGMWEDEEAFGLCEDGAAELSRLAEPLGDRAGDPESAASSSCGTATARATSARATRSAQSPPPKAGPAPSPSSSPAELHFFADGGFVVVW